MTDNPVLGALDAVPSSFYVATGLVGGFATARATRNRPLGGAVLAACGVLAGRQWWRHGPVAASVLPALYLAAFGGSHPLAKKIGAWPSVLAVTAVAAGTAWATVDRG